MDYVDKGCTKTVMIGSETEFVINKIVAIERGKWHDGMQDWFAVIVLEGNVRIETDEFSERAIEQINEALNEKRRSIHDEEQ